MRPTSERSCLILLLVFAIACVAFGQKAQPTVLLVSFDGFRHDYIDKYDLKNFKAFRENGSAAEGLIPCYPSLTFPNHYSIVTGLRPGNHGLVDNSFYDSAFSVFYGRTNRDAVTDSRFYGGTPLWTLARSAGLKTASYFWVGSEVADESRRPNKYFAYDEETSFSSRIDSVLSWLRIKDDQRPRFLTLYFSEPDHTAHETGPNSPETVATLLKMDSLLGTLMRGLAATAVPVNTILVSDHGMSDLIVADESFTFLDELYDVKSTKVRTISSSTLAHLYIDSKPVLDSMFSLLKAKESHFKVYRREESPAHWEYKHYRVGDLVIVSDPEHFIRLRDRKTFMERSRRGSTTGIHGYDPAVVTDMRGIFLAQGPQIKKSVKMGLVRNIDIYLLVARIMNLKLPPIDGDPKALKKIYVK